MNRITDVFKALSDQTRLRIARVLLSAGTELCICEIMDTLQLAQYNISRHVRELKLAGLVTERKAGRFVFYALARPGDGFHKQVVRVLESIDDADAEADFKRLKARLALRTGGRCVVGINKKEGRSC